MDVSSIQALLFGSVSLNKASTRSLSVFKEAVKKNREAVYGILCHTAHEGEKTAKNASGFMIAPGIVATVAHVLYREEDELHDVIEVIRAPDVGMNMEPALPIMIDSIRDLAFLRVENPRSPNSVQLNHDIVDTGTGCGSLGFPLASVEFLEDDQLNITLIERFQGGYVSAFVKETMEDDLLEWYETDLLMYGGSSGCPVFTPDGVVFGMQAATLIAEKGSDDESKRLSIARLVPSTDIIKMAHTIGLRV